jgi:DNA-binding IclR family transcriptional regulator
LRQPNVLALITPKHRGSALLGGTLHSAAICGSFRFMKTPKRNAKKSQDGQVTEATSYGPPATGSVKSAGRVLRILEFFDEIQREARVAEIAERLSFPQSSTSILLNCLVDLGYMDYLPESRSFLPSPRVTLLGTWLDKGPVRNGSLIRMLEEISHKTGDTVIVAARNGIFSQYIHVLQARSAMRFHVPHGTRRLVVWSATDFALLTKCTDNEIRALCTRTNAEAPSGQPRVEINQVLENVRQTRRDGYFFSTGLVTPGAGSIAVPLPDGIDGRDRALTVAVSGILGEIARREKDIVELLHDVAKRYLTPPSSI